MSKLKSSIDRFKYYKELGEKAMAQVSAHDLFSTAISENSISIIVNHLHGNMMSRWTNFREEDGEKSWRQRDAEFTEKYTERSQVYQAWEEGWNCLFSALDSIEDKDLDSLCTIRSEKHTIAEAIERQLAHYAYHIGQIVLIAKNHAGSDFQSLSIPKGQSEEYNRKKMSSIESST